MGPGDLVPDLKWTKDLWGTLTESINSQICLKFGTLEALVNPQGWFFYFLKIFIFRLYLGQKVAIAFSEKWDDTVKKKLGPVFLGHCKEVVEKDFILLFF